MSLQDEVRAGIRELAPTDWQPADWFKARIEGASMSLVQRELRELVKRGEIEVMAGISTSPAGGRPRNLYRRADQRRSA